MVSEVHLKFPKFTMNLAISLCSCQSNRELENGGVNFTLNFSGKLTGSLHEKFTSFGELSWNFLMRCGYVD